MKYAIPTCVNHTENLSVIPVPTGQVFATTFLMHTP